MARALSFAEDRLRGSGTRPGPEANPKQSRGAQEKTRKKKGQTKAEKIASSECEAKNQNTSKTYGITGTTE